MELAAKSTSNPSKDLTVVICTYKRPEPLRRVLDSLIQAEKPTIAWELLVVDNAECPRTQELCESFKDEEKLPIRYTREPRAGVAKARNRGWKEARGEWIAYLDDDCLIEPTWMLALEKNISFADEHHETPHVFGGRVLLLFENPCPEWLDEELLTYHSQIDWGTIPHAMPAEEWFGEGDMLIARAALEAIGGFEEAYGHKGSKLLSHEGNMLRRAFESLGGSIRYDPEMLVHHIVFEERIKDRKWLRSRLFWGGVSDAWADASGKNWSGGFKLKAALHNLKALLMEGSTAWKHREANEAEDFKIHCKWMERYGYALGLLGWR
jgi:glycosyltransferase involved in cell wall biosynthesis